MKFINFPTTSITNNGSITFKNNFQLYGIKSLNAKLKYSPIDTTLSSSANILNALKLALETIKVVIINAIIDNIVDTTVKIIAITKYPLS